MRPKAKFYSFLRPRLLVIRLGMTIALAAAANICLPWPLKYILDLRTANPFHMIFMAVAAFIGLSLARGYLFSFRRSLVAHVVENFGRLLSHALLARIGRASFLSIDRLSKADVVLRVVDDVEELKRYLTELLETGVVEGLTLFGTALLLFWMDWKFSAILILSLAPAYSGFSYILPLLRKQVGNLRGMDAGRLKIAQEFINRLEIVKAFNGEWHELGRYSRELKRRGLEKRGLARAEGRFFITGEGLTSLSMGVTFAKLGWDVSHASRSVGETVLFLQYAILLQSQVVRLAYLRGGWEKAMGIGDRLREIFSLAREGGTACKVIRIPARAKATLELRNVSFAYPAGKPIFDGVNLQIQSGERVALVGPSGSGKTSLLKLLLRFYEPTGGEILFEGAPIAFSSASDWRRSTAFVAQEAELFARSLHANLYYGVSSPLPAADELLEAFALGKLTARSDDKVPSLSGGERQRLTIVRALLRDSPIFLMDEPTASLDLSCERAVTDKLLATLTDMRKITVFVTHRPSLLRLATRIVELRDGKLFESSLERAGMAGRIG